MQLVKIATTLAALALAGQAAAVPTKTILKSSPFNPSTKRVFPMRSTNTQGGQGELFDPAGPKATPLPGDIKYNGGPLMTGQVNIYYVFYGNSTEWTTDAQGILTNFAKNVGESDYYNVEKTYYQQPNGGAKDFVKGPVSFVKSVSDNYSHGSSLSDQDIQTIVSDHINNKSLPLDLNGVYFVLTSSDVSETSGFCSQYCGWHNNFDLGGSDIKFSFIGNAATCLHGCAPDNVDISPNGNPPVDGMVSVIAHELMETISDPDPPSGWTDASQNENADKCAYVYGDEKTSANGAKYNVVLGGMQYLIQENWDASTQSCAIGKNAGGGSTSTAIPTSTAVPTSTTIPTSTTDAPTTTPSPTGDASKGRAHRRRTTVVKLY